ncbi:PEK protein kinase [Cladophialophora yegresii CBS 114405]|uniref:PEK protein kinase n=1 Tax=Cladophialophora yegresii CBS 114405 TaxID=1182544 RepID=W9VIK5_9EURO|nr:PEK protein kinase [Cladophialophora yegresii CBS 114405]EXJ55328.1 PEK protein kinase [Cladophialophora yegresii CBS 114405]
MTSAFFRRPTDGSSNSSSSSDVNESDEEELHILQTDVGNESETQTLTTESLPSHGSVSQGDDVDATAVSKVDRHRTNLLNALLEDFARNRASDYLNEAVPGSKFDRSSPEVQALAGTVYQQVSQSLAITGILPANNAADSNAQVRAAYLAGIESIAIAEVHGHSILPGQARSQIPPPGQQLAVTTVGSQRQDLAPQSRQRQLGNLFLHPAEHPSSTPFSELIVSAPEARRSHYESSFQQLRLLGKGGFGRVYHAYNIFDKKEYAVKKIPLSPRLSRRYRESGHQELENVLREVQALAQLEHNNVVRYHATWIEEPKHTPDAIYQSRNRNIAVPGRRLIADRAMHSPPSALRTQSPIPDHSDGIIFGSDSRSSMPVCEVEGDAPAPVWSVGDTDPEPSSARASEIFTDGNARPGVTRDSVMDDTVYVLHVQMSVYPTTLAQYLAPVQPNSRSALSIPTKRHCFHLVPALRLLMGILCGLQYIHARGLIHRDIKPSNIFISTLDTSAIGLIPDGYHDVGSCVGCPDPRPYFVNPRIGDFGLVAELARNDDGNQAKSAAKPVGTEYYRPPSMKTFKDNHVDEKLDVFALGVILVELLWPCSTSTERMHILRDVQKGKVPPRLGEKIGQEGHEASIGHSVIQCISGMIERDPGRRWSCPQVKESIESMLEKCKTLAPIDSHSALNGSDAAGLDGMTKVLSIDESTEQESRQSVDEAV